MRLNIIYDSSRNRLTSTAKVEVKEGGKPVSEAKGSVHGQRAYDVSDAVGTKVELHFTIPPLTSGGSAILDFTQAMEVGAGAKGAVVLNPSSVGRFGGDFHPRLFPKPKMVAAGKGRICQIEIDLTFIDMTDEAGANGILSDYDLMKPVFAGKPDHYDCVLRLLECTKGRPVAWVVLISPALKAQQSLASVPGMLFFRPAGANYTNCDDVKLSPGVLRYLGDPPSVSPVLAPFYARLTTTPHGWNPFPNCGWERQLAEAKKPVVLIHPVPHVADFGIASGPLALSLIEAVMRTLWSDNRIGQKLKSGLKLGKAVVSGFSFGGDHAFKAFKHIGDRTDELYLFDPNGFSAHTSEITTWFSKGGKKLRMVGGMLHDSMLGLAKSLGSPDATVKPDTANFWQDNDLYQAAVFIEEFSSISSSNAFSKKTGMFEFGRTNGDTAVIFEGRDVAGKIVGTEEVAHSSNREGAAMIEVTDRLPAKAKAELKSKKKPVPVIPVKNSADLSVNMSVIQEFVRWIRHQWPVCGGDDKAGHRDRGADFVGYLHQCLDKSSF